MLPYADVCCRMLPYADAHGRMLTYDDVCVQSVEVPGINDSGLSNVSGGKGNGSAVWMAEVARTAICAC